VNEGCLPIVSLWTVRLFYRDDLRAFVYNQSKHDKDQTQTAVRFPPHLECGGHYFLEAS
jgi:hypothetical protein